MITPSITIQGLETRRCLDPRPLGAVGADDAYPERAHIGRSA